VSLRLLFFCNGDERWSVGVVAEVGVCLCGVRFTSSSGT
jgi:hypothetical protein